MQKILFISLLLLPINFFNNALFADESRLLNEMKQYPILNDVSKDIIAHALERDDEAFSHLGVLAQQSFENAFKALIPYIPISEVIYTNARVFAKEGKWQDVSLDHIAYFIQLPSDRQNHILQAAHNAMIITLKEYLKKPDPQTRKDFLVEATKRH